GSGLPFSKASICTVTRAWLAVPSVVVTTRARNTPELSPSLQLPPLTISDTSVGTWATDLGASWARDGVVDGAADSPSATIAANGRERLITISSDHTKCPQSLLGVRLRPAP